jgi:flagellum-specific peptidoglycan hydrolase FlgJ
MKIRYQHIILLICLVAFSCGPKKGIVTKKKHSKKTEVIVKKEGTKKSESEENTIKVKTKPTSSTDSYIVKYAEIAKAEMRKSKVPASITLAQGILESGSGRQRLAVKANNHFGIKCHGWKGAKIYHDDDASQECFRKYRKAESSYQDHSKFLTGRKRYAKLFKLKPNDYKGWARGLKTAGYATDRKYPQKLISIIERYKLYDYDEEVLEGKLSKRVRVNSGVYRYVVVQGDTLYSLAKRYNTTIKAIKDLNNMATNNLVIGQEIMLPD